MRRHPIAFLSVFLCLITFLFSASSVSAQTSADVVLYAAGTPTKAGNWLVVADSTAASGSRLANPNASAAKLTVPLASPPNYFEMTFYAEAGKAYRLWLRGKAESNSYNNDSVYVQFSGSTTSSGAAAYLIGTTSAATVIIEDCTGCGLSGWGWQDNGYGTGVLGAAIYFAQTGQQTIRIQSREDGISIDQIVLSPSTYISSAPGALKKDATILAPNDGALPNQAPQVNITAYSEPSSTQQASASTATAVPTVQGPAPLVVHFSANASDPDGSIVAYSWDFGDSQSSQLVDPIHTYITPGSYNARLTVTDNLGVSATDILSVTVVVPTGATIFKVLGWNMHKGIGTDNVNSLSRIADYINKTNADVAAVCELMDYSTTSPGKALSDLLQKKSGVAWYYHWMPVSPGASQGQLILSKHPFESTGGKYLSYQRSVAQATISVNNRMINIFATHLAVESASWRWTEANELVSFAVGFSGDHIIVGDFNAGYTTPEMKFLTASFRDTWEEAVNGKTAVAYSDNRVCMDTRTRRSRIDYLLYSRNSPNLMLKSAQVPDTRDLSNKNVKLTLGTLDDNGVRPSDHNQTIATFEIK